MKKVKVDFHSATVSPFRCYTLKLCCCCCTLNSIYIFCLFRVSTWKSAAQSIFAFLFCCTSLSFFRSIASDQYLSPLNVSWTKKWIESLSDYFVLSLTPAAATRLTNLTPAKTIYRFFLLFSTSSHAKEWIMVNIYFVSLLSPPPPLPSLTPFPFLESNTKEVKS